MLKLSYKAVQEKLAAITSEMEQSLIEYFNRTDTPNHININKYYTIDALDEEMNYEFNVENVSYSEEDGHILLTSYDNQEYGFFHNQEWSTIQQVYSAVEFVINLDKKS